MGRPFVSVPVQGQPPHHPRTPGSGLALALPSRKRCLFFLAPILLLAGALWVGARQNLRTEVARPCAVISSDLGSDSVPPKAVPVPEDPHWAQTALAEMDSWRETQAAPEIADRLSRTPFPEIRAALAERILDGTLVWPLPLLQEEYLRAAFDPVADRQLRALVRLDPWNPHAIEAAHRIVLGSYRSDVRYEALKLLIQSESADRVDPSVREALLREVP